MSKEIPMKRICKDGYHSMYCGRCYGLLPSEVDCIVYCPSCGQKVSDDYITMDATEIPKQKYFLTNKEKFDEIMTKYFGKPYPDGVIGYCKKSDAGGISFSEEWDNSEYEEVIK